MWIYQPNGVWNKWILLLLHIKPLSIYQMLLKQTFKHKKLIKMIMDT